MIKRLLLIITTALLLIPSMSIIASEQIPELYYSHYDQTDDSALIESNNWAYQTFTTGEYSHTITSVKLRLKRTSTEPGTVTVSLRATDTGVPTGSDLTSDTVAGTELTTSYQMIEFEFSEISLLPDTTYAIVLRAISAESPSGVYWRLDDTEGYTGGTYGTTSDSGGSWTPGAFDANFEVWGIPAITIDSAAVFQDYLETGDMLFTVEYTNTYAPYYPYTDPETLFHIRLLDTDDATVLAQTTMKTWGNAPGSIYLNADSAAGLTAGSGYLLCVGSTSLGASCEHYELQPADWKGTDLNKLDSWVIQTAYSMEDWWGIILVESVDNEEVLNESGGVYFKSGIPFIQTIRPDIFKVKITSPTAPIAPTQIWDSDTEWQLILGSTISAPFTTIGDIFNISGKAVFGILLFLLYAALAIWLSSKNFTTAGILVGAPIILLGVYIKVIDIMIMAVALTIIVIMGVWSFWWSRT